MAEPTQAALPEQLQEIILCVSNAVEKGLNDFALDNRDAECVIWSRHELAKVIVATVLAWLKNLLVYGQNLPQDGRNDKRFTDYLVQRHEYITKRRFLNERIPLPIIDVPVQLEFRFVFSDDP